MKSSSLQRVHYFNIKLDLENQIQLYSLQKRTFPGRGLTKVVWLI